MPLAPFTPRRPTDSIGRSMQGNGSEHSSGGGARRRRFVIALVGAAALAAAMYGLRPSGGSPGTKIAARHLILLSLDTTRADHFGCYGHPSIQTPRMDALAAESILFTDYMTVAPSTLASHVSLFTGKYPHTHGTPRNGFMVNEANVMAAETFRDAGFRTVGFAGSFALDSRFDFAQGFDRYDASFGDATASPGLTRDERSAEAVTSAAVSYLDATGIPPHLFLFVHYFDPHTPYAPPPPFDTLYDPQGREGLPDLPTVWALCRQNPGQESPAARRTALQYAGEVSFMDRQIGRLLDYLRQRGVLDQAILVVTSDHGEDFWLHEAYFNHGPTTYQSTMQAVCLVRLPGAQMAGTRVQQLVASVDLLPTLLASFGLPLPEGVEGQAIDLLRADRPFPPRTRFGQATKPWRAVETDPRWYNARKARCIRRGDYKFIQVPFASREELYDLSADPQERNNLLRAPTPRIRELAAELRRELEAWAQSAAPLPSRFEPDYMEETIERLKSLGYIEP